MFKPDPGYVVRSISGSNHDLETLEFEVASCTSADIDERAVRTFEILAEELRVQFRKGGPFVAIPTRQAAVIRSALHRALP